VVCLLCYFGAKITDSFFLEGCIAPCSFYGVLVVAAAKPRRTPATFLTHFFPTVSFPPASPDSSRPPAPPRPRRQGFTFLGRLDDTFAVIRGRRLDLAIPQARAGIPNDARTPSSTQWTATVPTGGLPHTKNPPTEPPACPLPL